MSVKHFVEKLKKENPTFRKECEKIDLAFEIGNQVFSARIDAGLSQEKLAQKIGTKQPSIARIESGASLPSLSFLEKIAKALGTRLLPPQFEVNINASYDSTTQTEEAQISPYTASVEGVDFNNANI